MGELKFRTRIRRREVARIEWYSLLFGLLAGGIIGYFGGTP
jgi:hypothetical protein